MAKAVCAQFYNLRDLIALAGTCASVRGNPELMGTSRVLREALEGESATAYLADFANCGVEIGRVSFRYISAYQLTRRIAAHAIMRGDRALAEWARVELHGKCDNTIETFKIISGIIAKDSVLYQSDLHISCALVTSNHATRVHYALIEDFVVALDKRSNRTNILSQYLCQCFSERIGDMRASEWIEAFIARDVARACALVPLSERAMRAIFDNAESYDLSNHWWRRTVPIGPRFAQFLIKCDCIARIIGQQANGTALFEQCLCAAREICSRARTDAPSAPVNTEPFRILSEAAKNPDDMVFARVCEVLRATACMSSMKSCEIYWLPCEGLECYVRAVRRLESIGVRVSVLSGMCMSHNLVLISTRDAITYLDIILARVATSDLLAMDISYHQGDYELAEKMHGEPVISRIYAHLHPV